MTSVPATVHVFYPPPPGLPVLGKLDHLVKEFKSLASSQCAAGAPASNEGPTTDCDRMYFLAASQSLRLVRDELAKKEELAHKKDVDTMLKLDDLETALAAALEERKKLSQELKHSEKERVKAVERARANEEKLKTVSDQGEKDHAELIKDKKRVQQLQRKVDEFQRLQRMSPREDSSDGEKKKGKEPSGNTDITGLQRGLEKAKAQLKKKQDEYQLQAASLQQSNAKNKSLEAKIAEDKIIIDQRNKQIERQDACIDEIRAQRNSEFLSQEMEHARTLQILKTESENRERELKSEIAVLTRQSKQNAEKFKRAEEKASRIQSKLIELQNKPEDYSPHGDADIADRIRIRNLVDQTQERLATLVGLTPAPGESLSLCWRLALGPSTEDHIRILRAQELIADKDEASFTEHDRAFIENEVAFRHACQLYSRFRTPGNDLHKPFTRERYMSSVQRYLQFSQSERAGDSLVAMVNYVCSSTPSNRNV